jgi:hypothetical protein
MKVYLFQPLALVALAAAIVQAGCLGACDGQEYTYWTSTRILGGTVEAPTDLGLPAALDTTGECGSSDIETCQRQGSCSPAICLNTPSLSSPTALVINVSVHALSGPQTFDLASSPREVIVVTGTLIPSDPFGVVSPLTIVSGTVAFPSVKEDFDARIDVVFATPDGRTITVSGGRYAWLDGHEATGCNS